MGLDGHGQLAGVPVAVSAGQVTFTLYVEAKLLGHYSGRGWQPGAMHPQVEARVELLEPHLSSRRTGPVHAVLRIPPRALNAKRDGLLPGEVLGGVRACCCRRAVHQRESQAAPCTSLSGHDGEPSGSVSTAAKPSANLAS